LVVHARKHVPVYVGVRACLPAGTGPGNDFCGFDGGPRTGHGVVGRQQGTREFDSDEGAPSSSLLDHALAADSDSDSDSKSDSDCDTGESAGAFGLLDHALAADSDSDFDTGESAGAFGLLDHALAADSDSDSDSATGESAGAFGCSTTLSRPTPTPASPRALPHSAFSTMLSRPTPTPT